MRSVRFDPDLDRRVERAAKKRGVTVSDFIRGAVRRECDDTLDSEPPEDWKTVFDGSPYGDEWIKALDGVVGVVEGGEASDGDDLDNWARAIRERNWRT